MLWVSAFRSESMNSCRVFGSRIDIALGQTKDDDGGGGDGASDGDSVGDGEVEAIFYCNYQKSHALLRKQSERELPLVHVHMILPMHACMHTRIPCHTGR